MIYALIGLAATAAIVAAYYTGYTTGYQRGSYDALIKRFGTVLRGDPNDR